MLVRKYLAALFCVFLSVYFSQASISQSEGILINKVNFDPNFFIAGAKVISGYPKEGNLIIALTEPNHRILIDNEEITMNEEGLFVIGFHRDEDTNSILKIITDTDDEFITVLNPVKRKYDIQYIDGLKSSMVTPTQEVLDRITNDSRSVNLARNILTQTGDFWIGFDWPVIGRISGVFGSQRVLNGKSKNPHYGVDLAAPKGTVIRAPASGVVTLAHDLYYSGFTVILNHGLSVNSSFLHLDKIEVKVGDKLKRGDTIGFVGETGRSTGPHLDWRVDWQGRRLDAEMLAGPMTKH